MVGTQFEGFAVKLVDNRGGNILHHAGTLVDVGRGLDPIRIVVLGHQAYGLGLHAQVDIFGHQKDLLEGVLVGDVVRRIENMVIRLARGEVCFELVVKFPVQADGDFPFARSDGYAAVKDVVAGQGIQCPGEFACVAI